MRWSRVLAVLALLAYGWVVIDFFSLAAKDGFDCFPACSTEQEFLRRSFLIALAVALLLTAILVIRAVARAVRGSRRDDR